MNQAIEISNLSATSKNSYQKSCYEHVILKLYYVQMTNKQINTEKQFINEVSEVVFIYVYIKGKTNDTNK